MGGWGWPNAYVSLQGGWVGLVKYLRNHKNHQKRPNGPKWNAAQVGTVWSFRYLNIKITDDKK